MRSHFRIVLGLVVGISLSMILLLGFHVGGESFLNIVPYTPLLGAIIGTSLILVAVSIPIRRKENVEPWLKHEQLAWTLIGCGSIAWTIGNGFWTYSLAMGQSSFPSVSDIGFSSFPLLVFVGLILQPSSRNTHKCVFLIVYSLIVMGALLSIAWFLLLGTVVQTPDESPLSKFLHLYYPISDTALVSCIVFLLLQGSDWVYRAPARRISLLVLGLGLGIYSTGDFLFNVLQNMGLYVNGTWVDLSWPLGMMTMGVAAYLRRFLPNGTARNVMEEHADGGTKQLRFGSVQLVVFSLLFTMVFCVIAILSYSTSTINSILFGVFSFIFFIYFIYAFIAIKKSGKRKLQRESEEVIKRCPSCQKPITWENARFCSTCGTDLAPQCHQCHLPLKVGDAFCYQCGQSIAKNTPPIASSGLQIGSSVPITPTVSTHTSLSVCPFCNATRTPQDAFCGACGKSFTPIGTDRTIQQ